jgi:hypothetical protein
MTHYEEIQAIKAFHQTVEAIHDEQYEQAVQRYMKARRTEANITMFGVLFLIGCIVGAAISFGLM